MENKSGSNFSGAERRRFKRLNKQFVVRIQAVGNVSKGWDIVMIRNISKGGMCFMTSDELKTGDTLNFKINVKLNHNTILCDGTVIRVRTIRKPNVYEVGISFKDIQGADGDLISSTVEEILTKEPDRKPSA